VIDVPTGTLFLGDQGSAQTSVAGNQHRVVVVGAT
jgi:hypothetical protein